MPGTAVHILQHPQLTGLELLFKLEMVQLQNQVCVLSL